MSENSGNLKRPIVTFAWCRHSQSMLLSSDVPAAERADVIEATATNVFTARAMHALQALY